MNRPSRRNETVKVVLVAILAATVALASVNALGVGRTQRFQDNISLQGFEILTNGHTQESSLSAWLLVNSTSPLTTLHVFLNGTDQGTFAYSNNLGTYFIRLQTPLQPTVPIQDGNTYLMTVIATFRDGSTYTASSYSWAVYAVTCSGWC